MHDGISNTGAGDFPSALFFRLNIHLHWVRNVKPFRSLLSSSGSEFYSSRDVEKGRMVVYCNLGPEQIRQTHAAPDDRDQQWSCLSSTRRASHGGEVTWPSTSTLTWEIPHNDFAERKARHPKIKLSLFLLINVSKNLSLSREDEVGLNERDQQSDAQTSTSSTNFWARRTMEHVGWITLDFRDIPIIVKTENETDYGLWDRANIKRSVLKISGAALGAEMSVTSCLQCDRQLTDVPEQRTVDNDGMRDKSLLKGSDVACGAEMPTSSLDYNRQPMELSRQYCAALQVQPNGAKLPEVSCVSSCLEEDVEVPGTVSAGMAIAQKHSFSSQMLSMKENFPVTDVAPANLGSSQNRLLSRKPLGELLVRPQESTEYRAAGRSCALIPKSTSNGDQMIGSERNDWPDREWDRWKREQEEEWYEKLRAKEYEMMSIFQKRQEEGERERDIFLKSAVTEIHELERTLKDALADVERQKQKLRVREEELHGEFTTLVKDLERRAQSVQREANDAVNAATKEAETAERKSKILEEKMDKLAKEVADMMHQKQARDHGTSAFEALLEAQKENMDQQRSEQKKIVEVLQAKAARGMNENKNLCDKVTHLERLLNVEREKVVLLETRNGQMSQLEEIMSHDVPAFCDQELDELQQIRKEFKRIEQHMFSSDPTDLKVEPDDPT